MRTPEQAWAEARATISLKELGERLQPPLTRAAVSAWERVPAERVVEVARLLGVPRETLRPDLYAPDPLPGPWSALTPLKT